MKRYRVQIQETVTYQVDVEAPGEDEAAVVAEDIIVNAEDPNEYLVSVDERGVTSVEENPPNWLAD